MEREVPLETLLQFNEQRLARISGHAVGDEEYRLFVQRRIESLKQQIEQQDASN